MRGAKILRAGRNFACLRVDVGWRDFMFLKKSSDFFRILYWHMFVAIVIFFVWIVSGVE